MMVPVLWQGMYGTPKWSMSFPLPAATCRPSTVAIGVKLLCLALVAVGFANMWLAVFADVGVMILAVLNAVRALFTKNI